MNNSSSILIVEDNDINAAILTHFLTPYGFDIERCLNGQQAVDYIKENPVHIVMMDINMPQMNGCEATQIIRNLTDIEQPHIIAVTADSSITTFERCQQVGMNGFLAKPYNITQLSEILKPIIEPST